MKLKINGKVQQGINVLSLFTTGESVVLTTDDLEDEVLSSTFDDVIEEVAPKQEESPVIPSRTNVKRANRISKVAWAGTGEIRHLVTIPKNTTISSPFETVDDERSYGNISFSTVTNGETPRLLVWISETVGGPAIGKKYDKSLGFVGSMKWYGFPKKPGAIHLKPNTLYYLNMAHADPRAETSRWNRVVLNVKKKK